MDLYKELARAANSNEGLFEHRELMQAASDELSRLRLRDNEREALKADLHAEKTKRKNFEKTVERWTKHETETNKKNEEKIAALQTKLHKDTIALDSSADIYLAKYVAFHGPNALLDLTNSLDRMLGD